VLSIRSVFSRTLGRTTRHSNKAVKQSKDKQMAAQAERGAALVTGASSGIGRQIAVHLARVGFEVIIDHFRDDEGARGTLELVEQAGGQGWCHDADVGSASELDELFEQISKSATRLTVLVNNAAVQSFAPLLELDESNWDRTMRTNLKGTFLCTQRAGRTMRDQGGGSIVNIGSGANQVPFPKLGDYCVSKSGIEMLTKVSAVELGPYGIRVNCVAPGAIENERTRAESPDYAKTWGALAPLGRVGTEEDVAGAVEFLVSEQASFISGQTLFVDGALWTRNVWPYE
jgi:NAD(P)-dependent dehydrogenase (short-subunit alcohol dehydrogenase family)